MVPLARNFEKLPVASRFGSCQRCPPRAKACTRWIGTSVRSALRKARSKDLAQHVGITETNLSLLKSGRVKGIRFETLDAICDYLDCQPGDLLVHEKDG